MVSLSSELVEVQEYFTGKPWHILLKEAQRAYIPEYLIAMTQSENKESQIYDGQYMWSHLEASQSFGQFQDPKTRSLLNTVFFITIPCFTRNSAASSIEDLYKPISLEEIIETPFHIACNWTCKKITYINPMYIPYGIEDKFFSLRRILDCTNHFFINKNVSLNNYLKLVATKQYNISVFASFQNEEKLSSLWNWCSAINGKELGIWKIEKELASWECK